jgi:GNAT superfamily N-acetyltransferase
MTDMLVNLYDVTPDDELLARLAAANIRITRALSADTRRVLAFIERSAVDWPGDPGDNWVGECGAAMTHQPTTCFLAIDEHQIVGFACYDATAKGYFGPTGVEVAHQGRGIGRALLVVTLLAMREAGYGYGIIGWPAPDAVAFYERAVNAQLITGATTDIYSRLTDR